MSKKRKPNSRWNKGNIRYTEDVYKYIVRTYHYHYPWYKGARCSRVREV